MASSVLIEISKDEHERAKLRSQRKYENDLFTNIETSKEIARAEEREKWQGVLAEKDALLVEKDTVLAEKDARITELLARLGDGDGNHR